MRARAVLVIATLFFLPLPSFAQPTTVRFEPPPSESITGSLTVGEPFAYSLCLGQVVPPPGSEQGLGLSAAQSPCGSAGNPAATVSGGHPPYHFVLDSGWGFPPMGLLLDMNGVLRGTPRGTLPATFRVCAVDLDASQACQTITLQPRPASPATSTTDGEQAAAPRPRKSKGGSGAILVGAAIAGAAAIAVGAAVANAASEAQKCAAGQADCGDGHCCNSGSGCCGVYNGSEVCCGTGFVHYCPSTSKCYQTMPSCDFVVCYSVVGGADATPVSTGPGPRTLLQGNPQGASEEEGVPPLLTCPAR